MDGRTVSADGVPHAAAGLQDKLEIRSSCIEIVF